MPESSSVAVIRREEPIKRGAPSPALGAPSSDVASVCARGSESLLQVTTSGDDVAPPAGWRTYEVDERAKGGGHVTTARVVEEGSGEP